MMGRLGPIIVLAAVCAVLWWYHNVAVSYGLFGGTLAAGLDVAASLATAALSVVVVAELLIAVGFTMLMMAKPTGFERASVYAVLLIVAFGIVLSHLGVPVTTVLATSAVLTAIIGLALQPTLGALIAGLTLNADRMVRIGDGIVHGGEALTVTEIGWRSVSATRGDGTRVLLSNARILDGGFEILPGNRSVRVELALIAPLAAEPQRVADILTSSITDIAALDIGRPISVSPMSFDVEKAQARYRLRYWLRDFTERAEVEEEILRRNWYAFQRQGMAWPVGANFLTEYNARTASLTAPEWRERLSAALAEACRSPDGAVLEDLSLDDVVESGVLLLYGDVERITMPDRVEGHHCLLIDGEVRRIMFEFSNDRVVEARHASTSRLAELQQLTARLAETIGPYAEFAVKRAAMNGTDIAAIQTMVAGEIMDEEQRRRFIARNDRASTDAVSGPGLVLRIRRGATRELQADTLLRAVGRVAIVAIPPAALEPSGSAHDESDGPEPQAWLT